MKRKCKGCHSCAIPCGREHGHKNVYMFGNGVSRKGFDISTLEGKGMLVGFNWAYKEYPFDVICSSDPPVCKEIERNWKGDWIRRDDFSANRSYRDNVYWNTHQDLICKLPTLSHGLGWNTGRAAIHAVKVKFKPEKIYLFGFDLGGANIYTTIKANRPKMYETAWNFLFDKWDFTRVGPVDDMTDKLLCKHMTYEEFDDDLQDYKR